MSRNGLRPTDESETEMTSPTPGGHEPDSTPPAPPTPDDTTTTPMTPGADPHPDRAPDTTAAQPPVVESHPVAPKTAPARSALIAGAAGLAIVAGALGFGAGYITGDTTSERPAPAAVWQQGGNGPGMGGGPHMGGPQMGLPGRQDRDSEGGSDSGSDSGEKDGQGTPPGAPSQEQGQTGT
ncbi:hypothetical protein [Gordonia sp. 'Campus']|uniref:hypothetical protein n=1 Tax=Gordonia sp. 'Campus' TaxID=2915824 RepID=UPI001EE4ABD8|nr:hypothetical protein [Gordonia sp. 'Campus']